MHMNKFEIPLLLILGIVLSTVSVAATPTFTANVTCTGPKFGVIGLSFAYWNWTANGVPIGPFVKSGIISASGVLHCNSTGGGPNTSTGTGTQPSNANGIIASVNSQIKGCVHTTHAAKSFNPGQSVSISIQASCTRVSYGTVITETGTFTLTS